MCGIFGAVGNYDVELVKLLAVLNEDRGKDSFGIYNGTEIARELGRPRDSLGSFDSQGVYLMGHTRKASVGAVSIANAHPFQVGPIIGAHNGTVSNFAALKEKYKDSLPADFDVDSQLIFWGLGKHGHEFLKEIYAGWSISWTDARLPEYFFLACHYNPLAVAEMEGVLYYSSRADDLRAVGLVPVEVPSDEIHMVHTKTLGITKHKLTWQYRALPAPQSETLGAGCSILNIADWKESHYSRKNGYVE